MEARKKRGTTTNENVMIDGDLALKNPAEAYPFETDEDGKTWIDRKKLLRQDRGYWYVRRAQDIVLSLLALIVLTVPMLIVALVIWIDSPGASPIFMQKRVGRNGKTFNFLKFRSMVPDAETRLKELLDKNEMDGPAFKMKQDPRITRVGKFIRKTSIDGNVIIRQTRKSLESSKVLPVLSKLIFPSGEALLVP